MRLNLSKMEDEVDKFVPNDENSRKTFSLRKRKRSSRRKLKPLDKSLIVKKKQTVKGDTYIKRKNGMIDYLDNKQ